MVPQSDLTEHLIGGSAARYAGHKGHGVVERVALDDGCVVEVIAEHTGC
jgi:hypothetical protein